MPELVGYLLLFLLVGVGFILIHLLVGKLIRPAKPHAEKLTIYECGEPTIGSAWVQFDVRFYVVALLFVIFDVEVAFFFPWAVVFGGLTHTAQANLTEEQRFAATLNLSPNEKIEIAALQNRQRDLWANQPEKLLTADGFSSRVSDAATIALDIGAKEKRIAAVAKDSRGPAQQMAWIAMLDIGVFFGVLLVGFAYLWRRGDVQWVRSTAAERPETAATS